MSRPIRTARMRAQKPWGRVKDVFPYITRAQVDEDEECQFQMNEVETESDSEDSIQILEHPPQELIEISDDEKLVENDDHYPTGVHLTWFVKEKVIPKNTYQYESFTCVVPPTNWHENEDTQRKWVWELQNFAYEFNSWSLMFRKGFTIIVPSLWSEYEDFNKEFLIWQQWFHKQNPEQFI